MEKSDQQSRVLRTILTLCVSIPFFHSAAQPASAQPEPHPDPKPALSGCMYLGPSQTDPGATLCIRKESYDKDLCGAIEHFAGANRLPPDYFARLIWKESRFQPDALSMKGAQGIAQFMPGTAKLRGLEDSLDVLKSLRASAEYLDELRNRFGNLGLAAAAYNAGEAGLSNFLASGGLPYETRGYVLSITGHTADEWKNTPPDVAAAPLDKDKSFVDACVALARTKNLKEPAFQPEGIWAPWGVQLASNPQGQVARSLFFRVVNRLPAPLNAEQPLIFRKRDRSFGFRPRYVARIARQTRPEADKVCAQIRSAGGACTVFKN
ncbi:lytic transglycosylase domain-containing protein [Rhizobium sp. BK376]|uniref:transglycosylase SLT domain-containing protein n=1 Tax=Rhizobium sp. BK376 TaxID=2512149 RepID=UPI0010F13A67|nr:lytic transglycosylase domain-containing protein [Rhizobium sp. BK376]TCR90915.1 transglycosylase-like protein with SLT domain [Rhizobium sp. BK376]